MTKVKGACTFKASLSDGNHVDIAGTHMPDPLKSLVMSPSVDTVSSILATQDADVKMDGWYPHA
jgi:hypothetical protein